MKMAECIMIIVDTKEKATRFSGTSWDNFVSCAREWPQLSGSLSFHIEYLSEKMIEKQFQIEFFMLLAWIVGASDDPLFQKDFNVNVSKES